MLKKNSKRTSGNSLSILGAHSKDLGAASQTSLTEVRLRLRRRRIFLTLGEKQYVNLAKAKREASIYIPLITENQKNRTNKLLLM